MLLLKFWSIMKILEKYDLKIQSLITVLIHCVAVFIDTVITDCNF